MATQLKEAKRMYIALNFLGDIYVFYTEWRTKCHTIDCARNTFLLLQKHLTSGTELILIGWKIFPNKEHVHCDHRFASQPLANEPLHSSQLLTQVFRKRATQLHYVGPELRYIFWPPRRPENVAQLRAHIVKLCRAFWRLVSKSCDECKGLFAESCEAKRWLHWTCSLLETISQPMRINSTFSGRQGDQKM